MEFFGQTAAKSRIEPMWQTTLNLMGRSSGDPKILTGEVMNLDERIVFAREHNLGLLLWINFSLSKLAYLLGDYDKAEAHCVGLEQLFDSGYGGTDVSQVLFYQVLTWLAQARRGKKGRLAKSRQHLRTLRKWALYGPHNMLGKLYLLEAEVARSEGKKLLAVPKYMSSILHSREEGMMGQEALANELLGKYYLQLGEKEDATRYLVEACRLYESWGGVVKLEQLREEMDG
jgi:histidine kinase